MYTIETKSPTPEQCSRLKLDYLLEHETTNLLPCAILAGLLVGASAGLMLALPLALLVGGKLALITFLGSLEVALVVSSAMAIIANTRTRRQCDADSGEPQHWGQVVDVRLDLRGAVQLLAPEPSEPAVGWFLALDQSTLLLVPREMAALAPGGFPQRRLRWEVGPDGQLLSCSGEQLLAKLSTLVLGRYGAAERDALAAYGGLVFPGRLDSCWEDFCEFVEGGYRRQPTRFLPLPFRPLATTAHAVAA